jgi:hypothetical protein
VVPAFRIRRTGAGRVEVAADALAGTTADVAADVAVEVTGT